ncbi:unnamed protein product [Notodromas monacha]|uniref:Uncharacterized protein n=1 Tax=Notodromas monacha TaxID=399045 RepID=A0A7R9C1S7_9CRUS|nr:unnamed protein product [Notodromas monacha]CAG0924520.1 unnamed protein product [Notodromas monacha]
MQGVTRFRADQLVAAVLEELKNFATEHFKACFNTWIKRAEKYLQIGSDHIEMVSAQPLGILKLSMSAMSLGVAANPNQANFGSKSEVEERLMQSTPGTVLVLNEPTTPKPTIPSTPSKHFSSFATQIPTQDVASSTARLTTPPPRTTFIKRHQVEPSSGYLTFDGSSLGQSSGFSGSNNDHQEDPEDPEEHSVGLIIITKDSNATTLRPMTKQVTKAKVQIKSTKGTSDLEDKDRDFKDELDEQEPEKQNPTSKPKPKPAATEKTDSWKPMMIPYQHDADNNETKTIESMTQQELDLLYDLLERQKADLETFEDISRDSQKAFQDLSNTLKDTLNTVKKESFSSAETLAATTATKIISEKPVEYVKISKLDADQVRPAEFTLIIDPLSKPRIITVEKKTFKIPPNTTPKIPNNSTPKTPSTKPRKPSAPKPQITTITTRKPSTEPLKSSETSSSSAPTVPTDMRTMIAIKQTSSPPVRINKTASKQTVTSMVPKRRNSEEIWIKTLKPKSLPVWNAPDEQQELENESQMSKRSEDSVEDRIAKHFQIARENGLFDDELLQIGTSDKGDIIDLDDLLGSALESADLAIGNYKTEMNKDTTAF